MFEKSMDSSATWGILASDESDIIQVLLVYGLTYVNFKRRFIGMIPNDKVILGLKHLDRRELLDSLNVSPPVMWMLV